MKVGRDDRSLVVVVTAVQDVADGVPHPLSRLHRTQLIQHQNLGVKLQAHGVSGMPLRPDWEPAEARAKADA